MIEMDRVYTYEDCAKMFGKSEWYFRRRAQAGQIRAMAQNPKYPWQKAFYGKDIIKFLSLTKWGREYLTKWNIDVNTDAFKQIILRDTKKDLEIKLEALKKIEQKHMMSLENTRKKIKKVEEELKNIVI